LIQSHRHQNFKAPDESSDGMPKTCSTDFDAGELEDVLDFNQLAEQLIEDAAADLDSDLDKDPTESPPLMIRLLVHAVQAALPNPTPQQPTSVLKTAIPLKSLCIFPTDRNSPSTSMDYFWQGGIKNLDKEREAYDILCTSQEAAGKIEKDVLMASNTMLI
jgi:hypothetical protein